MGHGCIFIELYESGYRPRFSGWRRVSGSVLLEKRRSFLEFLFFFFKFSLAYVVMLHLENIILL
jgi:hypothetical protein